MTTTDMGIELWLPINPPPRALNVHKTWKTVG